MLKFYLKKIPSKDESITLMLNFLYKLSFTNIPTVSLTGNLLPKDAEDLLNLINGSLGAAGWLIVMSVGIVIAEIIFTVISIVNIQPTVKLIFGIIVSPDLVLTNM